MVELLGGVYTLQAKHRVLCKMVPNAERLLTEAVSYFQAQIDAMWFDIPSPGLTFQEAVITIHHADVGRLDSYLAVSPSLGIEMIAAIGAVRGGLQADIVKPGIMTGVWTLLKLKDISKTV